MYEFVLLLKWQCTGSLLRLTHELNCLAISLDIVEDQLLGRLSLCEDAARDFEFDVLAMLSSFQMLPFNMEVSELVVVAEIVSVDPFFTKLLDLTRPEFVILLQIEISANGT